MTKFRIVVATSSINVFRDSEFVMSVPLRVWQRRVDQSGKTTWFSQERSSTDRRALIDALVRATDQQSGIEAIRNLVRTFNRAIPYVTDGWTETPVRVAPRAGRGVRQCIVPWPGLRAMPQMRGRPRTAAIRRIRVTDAAAR